jgi:hypothetical protein
MPVNLKERQLGITRGRTRRGQACLLIFEKQERECPHWQMAFHLILKDRYYELTFFLISISLLSASSGLSLFISRFIISLIIASVLEEKRSRPYPLTPLCWFQYREKILTSAGARKNYYYFSLIGL